MKKNCLFIRWLITKERERNENHIERVALVAGACDGNYLKCLLDSEVMNLVKQFGHNGHLPCWQFTMTCFHISSFKLLMLI